MTSYLFFVVLGCYIFALHFVTVWGCKIHAIEEFAYVHYNHVRPHSYNNYKKPFETRYGRYKPDTKI